jgi:hypothetical protein
MPSHGRKPPDPRKVKPRSRDRRKPPAPQARGVKSTEQCCPMVAALVSVKQGRFRAARLYTRLSVRSIARRLA